MIPVLPMSKLRLQLVEMTCLVESVFEPELSDCKAHSLSTLLSLKEDIKLEMIPSLIRKW